MSVAGVAKCVRAMEIVRKEKQMLEIAGGIIIAVVGLGFIAAILDGL